MACWTSPSLGDFPIAMCDDWRVNTVNSYKLSKAVQTFIGEFRAETS